MLRGRRWLILIALGIVLVGGAVITLVILFAAANESDPRYVDSRALWDSKAIQDYRIGMDIFTMSIVPIGIDMIVQDGDILVSSFIACDTPNTRHPAANCDVIRRYYANMQGYTVEQLFDMANACITATRRLLSVCNATIPANFTSFSTPEDMMNATQNCPSDGGSFCAVEYDATWGYPTTIWQYTPQVTDGFSMVSVTGFTPAAP